jgi:ribosome-binding protein aMBF1 (putative translation factor)
MHERHFRPIGWDESAGRSTDSLHERPYGIADAMDVALARARRHAEESEREQVAAEVRDAIARSGLSRAEVASRIGTSRSRLSTYATGRVTPSASLMIRMRRVADRTDDA